MTILITRAKKHSCKGLSFGQHLQGITISDELWSQACVPVTVTNQLQTLWLQARSTLCTSRPPWGPRQDSSSAPLEPRPLRPEDAHRPVGDAGTTRGSAGSSPSCTVPSLAASDGQTPCREVQGPWLHSPRRRRSREEPSVAWLRGGRQHCAPVLESVQAPAGVTR